MKVASSESELMSASQQSNQQELNLRVINGVKPRDQGSEAFVASRLSESPDGQVRLLESILEPENLRRAIGRVRANKGAPGIDGMRVGELESFFARKGSIIKEAILDGTYQPLPALRKEIPKPDGGVRLLGIPAVVDRVIQQAMNQVLTLVWDHTFSEYSYGFRPGRSQHDAIRCCREHVAAGLRYCVDIDLSKFFDRVNHDRLMHLLSQRVRDKRVLKLIRKYLESGVMVGGLVEPTDEGTPQGGPLSPLLSNIVLDELDKELERRGLRFVRYADDCVIYVGSKRAGERVLESISGFIVKRLRLTVNEDKSAVRRPWESKYLGFTLTNSKANPKIRPHWKSIQRLKDRVREITKRQAGRSLAQVIAELVRYLRGWWQYFGIIESRNRLAGLENWIRRRLRSLVWKQWRNRRTRVRNLLKLGITRINALKTGCARRGCWRMSNVKWVMIALPNRYFEERGLVIPWA